MDIFQALADAKRRHIIEQLSSYEAARHGMSIKELTQGLSVSRQAVTKHLDILMKCGAVKVQFEGKEKRHFLIQFSLLEAWQWLEPIARQWDEKLAALNNHLRNQ